MGHDGNSLRRPSETIRTESTSATSADADPVVLRETSTTRLLFRPAIVENPNEPSARVRGEFVFQRKGPSDEWIDHSDLPLTSLRASEWVKLELHAAETLALFNHLEALYGIAEAGVPMGSQAYARVSDELVALIESGNLASVLDDGRKTQLLHELLTLLSDAEISDAVAVVRSLTPAQQAGLAALLGLQRLETFRALLGASLGESSEEFWQQLLAENSWVFSQVSGSPLLVINEKAYVGGKRIDNTGGSLVDFLCANQLTATPVLVEIKPPTARLQQASAYRSGAYAPDGGLSGAVVQLLQYREQLAKDSDRLMANSGERLSSLSPRCLLLAGRLEALADDHERIRSFELFRNDVHSVEILTYDELLAKIDQLISILRGSDYGEDREDREDPL